MTIETGRHDAAISAILAISHPQNSKNSDNSDRSRLQIGRRVDAQERGEVAKAGNPNSSGTEELPGVVDLGLTHKQVHEARRTPAAKRAKSANPRSHLAGLAALAAFNATKLARCCHAV